MLNTFQISFNSVFFITDSEFVVVHLFGSGCDLNDSEMSSELMNYKSNMGCAVNISWHVKVIRMLHGVCW